MSSEVPWKGEFHLLTITPEVMGSLWRHFAPKRHIFPDFLVADVPRFVAIMSAPSTIVYALGDLEGIVYFTNVLPPSPDSLEEPLAVAHVYVWGKHYLRSPEIVRAVGLDLMARTGIRRIVAEIPAWNSHAIRLVRRVGMRYIGRFRKRVARGGRTFDSLLFDALASDLVQAAQAGETDGSSSSVGDSSRRRGPQRHQRQQRPEGRVPQRQPDPAPGDPGSGTGTLPGLREDPDAGLRATAGAGEAPSH